MPLHFGSQLQAFVLHLLAPPSTLGSWEVVVYFEEEVPLQNCFIVSVIRSILKVPAIARLILIDLELELDCSILVE